MYYEETVVDGELCYRTTINGVWTPFTNEELTKRIQELEQQIRKANESI